MRRIIQPIVLVATILLAGSAAAVSLVRAQSDVRPEPKTAALYRESYALEARQDFAGALAKMREVRQGTGKSYFATLRVAWLSYPL